VLSIGALAAVKAQRQAEQQRTKKEKILLSWKRKLQSLGLLSPETDELRKQIAATRIQRAWRATVNRHPDEDAEESYHSTDVAWEGRHSANNFDRVLAARSILRQNASLNYRKQPGQNIRAGSSLSTRNPLKRRAESQVGSAMRELTGQRVAIGIILALVLTVLFSYSETDSTRQSTMVILHDQTQNPLYASMALNASRSSSIPDLFEYIFASGNYTFFPIQENVDDLRDMEILKITVSDTFNQSTVGKFSRREDEKNEALVELLATIFILLAWFIGVTAFAGPVMILVVIPIERMVRLLGMLMLDPLGYQSTKRYKKFIAEQDEFTKNTRWTNEVLKGMETSFLMSTIARIGSLMKVGFGSAGVEIIKNNLEKGSKNMLILSSQGSIVSCIFLFCDIRQFTDATECLQEEVFVFTNRIAAVVHSICHSYGGSANKNIGDAFLLSWMLEDDAEVSKHGATRARSSSDIRGSQIRDSFVAKNFQADKALLSVVKICIALHHDDYYLEQLSENARDALLAKIAGRKGPVVQLGFGLHAGKAVQGAIGSQRKIDATYVSEAVERAEFLESSTKKYGVKMLMSDSFHRLLHPSNRRRCRKVDQIILKNDEDDDEDQAGYEQSDIMELLTFDMDIDALWKVAQKKPDFGDNSDEETVDVASKRDVMRVTQSRQSSGGLLKSARRRSLNRPKQQELSEDLNRSVLDVPTLVANQMTQGDQGEEAAQGKPELVLPTGPALYSANVWLSEDMRKIRQLYSDGLFFQKFNSGLQSFYAKDWEHAKQCFQTILERFEDGPSRYFLNEIESRNGIPPRNFLGYGIAG
jgi:class 3 adenylate cyclase